MSDYRDKNGNKLSVGDIVLCINDPDTEGHVTAIERLLPANSKVVIDGQENRIYEPGLLFKDPVRTSQVKEHNGHRWRFVIFGTNCKGTIKLYGRDFHYFDVTPTAKDERDAAKSGRSV